MDSSFSNSESNLDPSLDSSPKKRRKIDPGARSSTPEEAILNNRARWRTDAAQQIYSSKLVEALRHVRRESSPSVKSPSAGGRLVREAADRVLAAASRRKTRWSRAILTKQLSRRLRDHKKAKVTAGGRRLSKKRPGSRAETRTLPAVQRKVKFLGRLVPGCRKLPLANLLEEARDYIAALEMQVRAMTALTELLGGMGSAETSGREAE